MRTVRRSVGMLGGILIALGVASCSDGLAPELTQRPTPHVAHGGGGGGGGGDGGDSGPSAGRVGRHSAGHAAGPAGGRRGGGGACRSVLAGGGPPLGYALSGVVAAALGAPLALLVGAGACALLVVGIGTAHRELRDPNLGSTERS